MKTISSSLSFFLACLMISGCASIVSQDPADLPSGQWELDQNHASIIWRVQHMGLSWYTARFDEARASLDFDPARPEDAQLTAIVDAASVSTGDEAFDITLRGRSWLNTSQYPDIVFESREIVVTGDTTAEVHGTLSFKGSNIDAIMETEFYGGAFNFLEQRQAIGFNGEILFDLNQIQIGGLARRFVGDEVRIIIEAEFLKDG